MYETCLTDGQVGSYGTAAVPGTCFDAAHDIIALSGEPTGPPPHRHPSKCCPWFRCCLMTGVSSRGEVIAMGRHAQTGAK